MSIVNDIKQFADEDDKPVLLWLFNKYSYDWRCPVFMRLARQDRYGSFSFEVNNVYEPTNEGRILYNYFMENGE